MSGLKDMSEQLIRQYSGLYGPFVPGEYAIGEQLTCRIASGEVVWSYQAKDGFMYCIDTGTGFPVEVFAKEIRA